MAHLLFLMTGPFGLFSMSFPSHSALKFFDLILADVGRKILSQAVCSKFGFIPKAAHMGMNARCIFFKYGLHIRFLFRSDFHNPFYVFYMPILFAELFPHFLHAVVMQGLLGDKSTGKTYHEGQKDE